MGWDDDRGGVRHSALPARNFWTGSNLLPSYLFNPFTIAACLGRSTNIFTNTGILFALASAVEGNNFKSMLALGFASYMSLYPALLFPPLALLCYDRSIRSGKPPGGGALFALKLSTVLGASVAFLLYISYLITGSWEFIPATYGVQLLVPDLTPNIGLWWYFFIEIFDPFREFFLGVFWLHLAGYVGGLTIRIRRQPLFVITSLLGIFAIFKPYPSISDVSLYFALLPLYRHIFPCELPQELACQTVLTITSDEIHLLCHVSVTLCDSPRSCFLPSVDIRRLG
jgi:phosphatidylinositol glycan class U